MTEEQMYQRKAVKDALEAKAQLVDAIKTMRRFLDDAEREVNRDSNTMTQKIAAVSHGIAWGNANANSNINSAMRLVDESNQALLEMWKASEEQK